MCDNDLRDLRYQLVVRQLIVKLAKWFSHRTSGSLIQLAECIKRE